MARPREFDQDKALQGAMDIFWRLGYGATNLPQLLRAMGLTRGSFYKAFGDKRTAYLMALRRYRDNELAAGIAFLTNALGAPAADRIVAFFNGIGKDGSRRGCFLCNAMVELAPSDPEVAALTRGMEIDLRDAFRACLGAIAGAGSVSDETLDRRAAFLTQLYLGAQATSKTGEAGIDWASLVPVVLPENS